MVHHMLAQYVAPLASFWAVGNTSVWVPEGLPAPVWVVPVWAPGSPDASL